MRRMPQQGLWRMSEDDVVYGAQDTGRLGVHRAVLDHNQQQVKFQVVLHNLSPYCLIQSERLKSIL
jgi:hypothetical protein